MYFSGINQVLLLSSAGAWDLHLQLLINFDEYTLCIYKSRTWHPLPDPKCVPFFGHFRGWPVQDFVIFLSFGTSGRYGVASFIVHLVYVKQAEAHIVN